MVAIELVIPADVDDRFVRKALARPCDSLDASMNVASQDDHINGLGSICIHHVRSKLKMQIRQDM